MEKAADMVVDKMSKLIKTWKHPNVARIGRIEIHDQNVSVVEIFCFPIDGFWPLSSSDVFSNITRAFLFKLWRTQGIF